MFSAPRAKQYSEYYMVHPDTLPLHCNKSSPYIFITSSLYPPGTQITFSTSKISVHIVHQSKSDCGLEIYLL